MMKRYEVIAQEIAKLIPKLFRGNRVGFVAAAQVTAPQMITLVRIYEQGIVRVGALSKEMRVSAPTITGTVDRLLHSGYLRRIRDKKDRRVVNVELTTRGKDLVKRILFEINKMWCKRLIYLSEEERESFLRILRRIVGILEKENV